MNQGYFSVCGQPVLVLRARGRLTICLSNGRTGKTLSVLAYNHLMTTNLLAVQHDQGPPVGALSLFIPATLSLSSLRPILHTALKRLVGQLYLVLLTPLPQLLLLPLVLEVKTKPEVVLLIAVDP